jgi:hypothetical protein
MYQQKITYTLTEQVGLNYSDVMNALGEIGTQIHPGVDFSVVITPVYNNGQPTPPPGFPPVAQTLTGHSVTVGYTR